MGRGNHIDWHYDKCCEAWCEMWEQKQRITKNQERGVSSAVLESVNRSILEEYETEYRSLGWPQKEAVMRAGKEQYTIAAVRNCKRDLLGEKRSGGHQRHRVPKLTYKNRVEMIRRAQPNGDASQAALPVEATGERDDERAAQSHEEQRAFFKGMGIDIGPEPVAVMSKSEVQIMITKAVQGEFSKYEVCAQRRDDEEAAK